MKPSKSTVPHLRFPEFEGNWQVKTVRQVLEKRSVPVEVQAATEYSQIGLRSHGKGIFHKDSVTGESLGEKRVFWVQPNCLVLNIVFAWEQAVATTSERESGMVASHRFPMYEGRKDLADVDFLLRFFLRKKGKHLLGLASPGGAGRNRTLGQNEFDKLKLILPTLPEQQKIAAFLTAVDGRIEQLSRKKALLEATKKGVMQQLFTQTLRFQDDHGHDFPDWEEKTLGDVVDLLSGQHLGPEDYNEDGQGVPYFTGPSDFTSDPSSFTKWTTQNTKIAKPDSVLITVKGNGVGRVMYSTLDQVALGRQLMALHSSSCDNRYLYQYLLTKAQEFVALGSGNLIPGLSRGDILTMALPIPSLPEQTKIAGFLSALDGKIGAVGEQMRQAQTWKKGLLQQMFV